MLRRICKGGVRGMMNASYPALVALLAGCSTYSPARTETLQPNANVMVVLSATGTDSLKSALGPGINRLKGRYEGMRGDAVMLRVQSVEGPEVAERNWSGEPIAVPRRFVDHVEEAHLSKSRTAMFAGGAIGALLLLNSQFGLVGRGGGIILGGSSGAK